MTTTIPRASAILGAARTLAAKLLLAIPIDRAALTQAMIESAGGSDAAGAWNQRESFEALEVALSIAIPELVGRMDAGAAIATLEALAKDLPTHTVRSEDQIAFQQFSTPPALACLAVHLARLASDDVFLEPSAGTGIIASLARSAVWLCLLNELEPARADLLEGLFPGASVYRHDGAKIAALLAGTERPSVIVMNPPFSISQSRGEDQNTAARHLRAALDHLVPGGRIVAIMPDWFTPSPRGAEVFRRHGGHLQRQISHVQSAEQAIQRADRNQEQRGAGQIEHDVVQAGAGSQAAAAMQNKTVGSQQQYLEEDEQIEQIAGEECAVQAEQLQLEQDMEMASADIDAAAGIHQREQRQHGGDQQHPGAQAIRHQHDAERRRPVAERIGQDVAASDCLQQGNRHGDLAEHHGVTERASPAVREMTAEQMRDAGQ